MIAQTKILLIIFVPIVVSLILPLLGSFSPKESVWTKKLRNSVALLSVLVSLILSLSFIPQILSGTPIPSASLFGISLNVDGLAVFMAAISSFIGSIVILYSFGYIRHYENQNEYYLMVVLFIGSMMGIVFSGNLILLYIFWEITAIACWRLIGFFRKEDDVYKANKAFLVTVFGALVMLVGFIMIYFQTGSFDLITIKNFYKASYIPNLAVILILFGILSKSATLPFHTWLPDAGVAPTPVTAILHAAVLVKIGVYVFARLFLVTFNIDPVWHTIVPIIAGVSALVAAGAALVDTDMKRILAFSTVSQIGFTFLGLSIGNTMGIAGGLLLILMHGISKGGLFLCAGIVEQNTGTRNINKLGGLISTMPITAAAFLFCSFSIMGIPPFGGFFSKYMVIFGAVKAGHPYIAILYIAIAFLTLIYILRVFRNVFLGELKISAPEKTTVMVSSVALLGLLSLLSGILIKFPADFVGSFIKLWR